MDHDAECPCVPCLTSSGRAVTRERVAELLGCSELKVKALLRRGELTTIKKFGRRTWFLRSSVDRLLAKPGRIDFRRRPDGNPKVPQLRQVKRSSFERYLQRAYGIAGEDWARMYQAQAGKCAGCQERFKSDRETHVDHCHETGRIRGLLCSPCNVAVGLVKDSAETLRRLAEYLHCGDTAGQVTSQAQHGT